MRRTAASSAQRPPRAAGTQAISRAARLLRLLASDPGGVRFADIVERSELEHPTVHRILKGLAAEGLVAHEGAARRYTLGPLAFELGLAARPRFDTARLCGPALDRIAEKTGDTVFLSVPSGDDSVCIDRRIGSFPVKTLTLDVGTRRPLGVGAGGLALLLMLAPPAAAAIIAANAKRLAPYQGLTATALTGSLERCRRLGYALNDVHNTAGVVNLGLPLANRFGQPLAAISVGAIASRMTRARQLELVALLRAELRPLEAALRTGSAAAGG